MDEYLDGRKAALERGKYEAAKRYKFRCNADDFITLHSHGLFTNLVQSIFTRAYMSKKVCPGSHGFACGQPATTRAHITSRPQLIRAAFESARCKTDTDELTLWSVIVKFIELHNETTITFKCENCHRQEGKPWKRNVKDGDKDKEDNIS